MKKTFNEKKEWIFEQHRKINHTYDGYLPYEFHLKLTHYFGMKYFQSVKYIYIPTDVISLTLYGHDLLEDTHVSYNDIVKVLGQQVADIIYALTNEKGKTRSERANDKYYKGIVDVEGATLCKLADRMANVHYSSMFGSSMFQKYKKENVNFVEKLNYNEDHVLYDMFFDLIQMLDEN
jgi:hypothetical protein